MIQKAFRPVAGNRQPGPPRHRDSARCLSECVLIRIEWTGPSSTGKRHTFPRCDRPDTRVPSVRGRARRETRRATGQSRRRRVVDEDVRAVGRCPPGPAVFRAETTNVRPEAGHLHTGTCPGGRSRVACALTEPLPPAHTKGSSSDYVYFVESGQVSLTRQIAIKRFNKWPADAIHWERVDTTTLQSFVVDVVAENDCFNDEALLGTPEHGAVCAPVADVGRRRRTTMLDDRRLPIASVRPAVPEAVRLRAPVPGFDTRHGDDAT